MPADEQPVVEREAHFDVAPEELWEAITDPDLLAEWFGPAELDVRPGGPITVPGDAGEAPRPIGVVERVEPPHRIGFVWLAPGSGSPSEVELVIEDDDGGSVLHVREVPLQPRWEQRPDWLPSVPQARALARA